MKYAENTQVSVARSKAEIEDLLTRHGASGFASGWVGNAATIMFQLEGRCVKFCLPLPPQSDFATKFDGRAKRQVKVSPEEQIRNWEQAQRQKWRALSLCIKAKLEACASGITSLEHEFLAHFVQANGRTIGDQIIPELDLALEGSSLKLIGM